MSWIHQNDSLYQKFRFASTQQALQFVNQICLLADVQNHHPKIILSYTKVEIYCTTHDSNNTVTELDYTLAMAIEQIHANLKG